MSDYTHLINWYPGHMAKTKRLLQEQIKRIDLVIEVCDARLPSASRNPDLISMTGQKQHMLFLNKSDLSNSYLNKLWLNFFRDQGINAFLTDAAKIRSKETVGLIHNTTKDLVDKALSKGVRKTIRAMIVGIPNVGKSTLINRLYGRSITEIGDRPGVTRTNQWVKISPYLELLDTPGLLWPKLDDQNSARKLCYIGSLKDDILDRTDITIHLLEELCVIVPEKLKERYHIPDMSLRGTELLDAVCMGRGWLMKGAQYDYDRCCSVVLDEFRSGKLGRITLEAPIQK